MIEIIKFKNGEMIIADCALIGSDIELTSPVSVLIEQYYEGDSLYETYELRPWIPLTDSTKMIISSSDILVGNICNKMAADKYKQYINKPDSNQPLINISRHLH